MELKTQLIKICCEGCEDKSCNENCPDYKYIELVLAEFDQLTAEKAEIEASRQAYIKILDETMLENEVLQSWLDKISGELLRSKEWANHIPDNTPLPYPVYKTLACVYAYLDPQKPSEKPLTERHGGWISADSELPSGKWGINYPWLSEEVLIVNSCSISIGYYNRHDRTWYVGEPAKEEWIDKITHWMPLPVNPHVCSPKCEHSDDSGVFWEGNEADCPICNPQKHLCNDGIWEYVPKSECQRCNPLKCEHKNLSGGTDCLKGKRCLDCGEWTGKPLTQCPECIWGQKKVQYERKCLDYPYTQFYFVYERCPRCRGGGRIPC